MFLAAASLVVAAAILQWSAFAEEKLPKLYVVDRSVGKDDLYYCSVNIPSDVPVETIGLILKDRQDKKVGEALLGTIDTSATEKMATFFLNHELVKRSVVIVAIYPLDDDRHKQIKFIVGDEPAVLKKDGKTVQVKIE